MFIKMFIISAVQGITEFIPVSSSGHMILFEKFLHYNPHGATLEIMLHLATLLSITVFFNKRLFSLLTLRNGWRNPLLLIVIGTIPAAVIGVLFNNKIEEVFDRTFYLPYTFLLNGLILLSFYFADRFVKANKANSPILSFFIGIAQAVAILPGVSRSGTTITASRWLSLSREEAFDYSFYLLYPAVLGAVFLNRNEVSAELFEPLYIFGFFVAFFLGLFSLILLRKLVVKGKLHFFGIYSIFLSILLFAMLTG